MSPTDRILTYNASATTATTTPASTTPSPHIHLVSAITPAVIPIALGGLPVPAVPSYTPPAPVYTPAAHSISTRMQRDPPICPTDDDTILPSKSRLETSGRTDPQAYQQKVDKRSWEYIIKSGLAGGMAGCAAKSVVAPLDRVKILFQASNPQFAKYTGTWSGVAYAMRDIFHADGSRGLFRGHSATLLRIFPYAGIKFLAYEQVRNQLIRSKQQETPVRRFMAGSIAGMISVFFTYPLEVIRVRLAWQTKADGNSSISGIIRTIYHERPKGTTTAPSVSPNVLLDSSSATALAGNAASAAAHAAPTSGIINFFRGFAPTLCGMVPYAGASFLAHDTISDMLRHPLISSQTTIPNTGNVQTHSPPKLVYWAELFSGGFAGFISQTVSYPLEVIRRRMQVGGVVGDGHRLRMGEVARTIWAERGWRGFFVGLGIGYVKVVPMVATSFFAYERCKWWLGI